MTDEASDVDASIGEVLRSWGIADVTAVDQPSSGSMNDTWLVTHAAGRVVLRRHRHLERCRVEAEHHVIEQARLGGVPVAAPIRTPGGEAIVECDGHTYTLYRWVPGIQIARPRIDVGHARLMGSMLAHVHRTLHNYRDATPDVDTTAVDMEVTRRRIDDLTAAIEVRHRRNGVSALVYLEDLSRWLDSHPVIEFDRDADRAQVIHGDFQETNLFFSPDGTAITAVIDWDKARIASPAMEVVRAVHHALGMVRSKAHALVEGYRCVLPLPTEVLIDAAHRFGQQQAHSLWVLEQVYIEDNVRAMSFHARTFEPFERAWRTLGFE